MANDGVATMLRVQQYVNTIGTSGKFPAQSNWSVDPAVSDTVAVDIVDRNSEPNSHSSPIHKPGLNGSTENKDAVFVSQGSIENGADATGLPPDECWLYKCPKRSSTSNQPLEPIQHWLRATFDSPDSIFYSSRRNLLTRLEIILASGGPIDAYRFGGSVPSLNQIPPSKPTDSVQRARMPPPYPNLIDQSRRIASAGSSDSLSMTNQNNNANNYGKLTKPKYSLPPQYSNSCAHRPDSMTNLSTGTQNLSQSLGGQLSGLFSGSPAKTGSLDELEPNASRTNIQEIARIQEDNLKADVAAMAAAAAASGRHGSHHSLASLGRRSPDGSYSRVPSAPESPHSSNPQLAGPITNQPIVSHVHRPTVDLSSTTFATYMVPEAIKTSTANEGSAATHPPPTHVPRLPQTNIGETRPIHTGVVNNSGLNIRHAYSALPQKPTIPTTYQQLSSDVQNTGMGTVQNMYVPPPTVSSSEPRNQFGFRSMRRIPGPQYSPRPPAYVPPSLRPNHHNGSSMEKSG
ncbi:unnamed protein product [Echinostoma caproni]|uniref:Zn(2)-C6 fungal-type domain-containing protein n=1 Tax=Echinostoma caproni TaxID=27848 RepID=A0A183AWR3_9TREM|nr:unnamed protein product [Echinostoma caproni]